MEKEITTYIKVLVNSLEKKEQLLEQILDVTNCQEEVLNIETFSMDDFEASMEEKQNLIDTLNQLDMGFEGIYERVKDELANNQVNYKTEIASMQSCITRLTNLSVKIQAMEERNKIKLESSLQNQRQKIRTSKMSSQTATTYYKNMANQHQAQSYFLDKKK